MSADNDPFKPFSVSSPPSDADALRLEVNHVQVSGVLGEARLRRMFDYLAEKSLAGQSPKEIAIAIDVSLSGLYRSVSRQQLDIPE